MSKFATQHFTPTSTEDSAYAWDSLADAVLGHAGTTTTQAELGEAFSHLTDDDARLLLKILGGIPEMTTRHLYSAAQRRVTGIIRTPREA